MDALLPLSMSVGAIALLLLAGLWLLRRSRPGAGPWAARDCAVVRSLALGPRERLMVVQVGARQLVLGVSPTGVSLLCELAEPLPPAAPAGELFGEALRKAMGRWRGG